MPKISNCFCCKMPKVSNCFCGKMQKISNCFFGKAPKQRVTLSSCNWGGWSPSLADGQAKSRIALIIVLFKNDRKGTKRPCQLYNFFRRCRRSRRRRRWGRIWIPSSEPSSKGRSTRLWTAKSRKEWDEAFASKWSKPYPKLISSLLGKADSMFRFYEFPKAMWKSIYTSNAAESPAKIWCWKQPSRD